MTESIYDLVRKQQENYISGRTTISKYVEFSQYENIEKIDAYLNSKHISGETDSMGREKPFFNIVIAARNIWFRATDIDRKNIRFKPTKMADTLFAFLATVLLQQWMRDANFGKFLNDWGLSLSSYGSQPVKFVEQGGELHPMVIPWNRTISDTVDFESNIKIEKLELTPAQLRKRKGYDKEAVKALLESVEARRNIDGQKKDNVSDYIEVFEVHGELPLCYITGNEDDEDEYVEQMHVISYVEQKKGRSKKGAYDDFTLYSGREAKDPYMITHLIPADGRSQSVGAVEYLFEPQWMMNHTAKQIKDQLDLASKLIFQTSDGNFVGQNALSAIETGDILIHGDNQPLVQVQNNSHDITSIQAYGQQWQALAKEITSTPDAISGNTMPSGTAYRQVAILNQESHSLFEIMTENKGLAIEEMMRRYVIPFLKKKLDHADEITAILEAHDIAKIDSMYVKNKAIENDNKQKIDAVLNGEMADNLDLDTEQAKVQESLKPMGNQRYFVPSEASKKTWKELLKSFDWDSLEVEVTNEQEDTQAVATTLSGLFTDVSNQVARGIPMSPEQRFLFNKILETTAAVSPIELPVPEPSPPQQPQMPQMPQQAPQPQQQLTQ